MKKNVLCLGLLMTGVLACFQTEAQTITAPLGTPLTITNSVDVTLPTGNVNVPADGSFNFGGKIILSTKGTGNVLLGESAGGSNTGTNNVFVGTLAGFTNTTGSNNIHFGSNAGRFSTGSANTFIGGFAGYATTGTDNLFMGSAAGFNNTSGSNNICIGSNAGRLSNGISNTFVGYLAGFNTTGNNNLFMGDASGVDNVAGNGNVFLGPSAGRYHVAGDNNTYIGNNARGTVPGLITNASAVGANALVTTSNTVVLGSAATVVIGASAASASPAKLEVTGSTPGKSGIKCATMATGALSGPGNNIRTGGFLTVNTDGEIVWAATGASRLGNPDGITSAEGTATFSDNNWSLSNGYLKNTSKRVVVIGEGITSMPEGYSFYVADGILTEKVKVAIKGTDEWADYVFGKNYNRMSLTDVAKYIEKNNHLPNVPSAAEMVQNGNDLHKTDVKLLEKIEELTLYMIEMKKENEQLKKDVDSLKKRRK
jgi:trimeric autotransporter adhesin